MTSQPEFDLFISYVRRDVRKRVDGTTFDVVANLKQELESHKRPSTVPGRTKRFRVCTDVDDFDLDDTFDRVMQDRLSHSRGFLLICTAGVLGSKFVQRELEIHKSLPGRQKPLAAVLSSLPTEVAPSYFTTEQVAADLVPPEGVTRREWHQLLRRESHKIVARTWGLTTGEVHDRFEADRRTRRRQMIFAALIVALFVGALIVGLKGEAGLHRTVVLPVSGKLVAPNGVGFASDGRTPIVINGDKALIWSNGLNRFPIALPLPFQSLHACVVRPGEMAIAGLNDLAIVAIPTMEVRMRTRIEGKIAGIAAQGDELVAATEDGALLFFEKDGRTKEAPRPPSTGGRRFPAFREKGPFKYGGLLGLNEHYLATATLEGRFAILDRRLNAFVTASQPQFPLAPPIEQGRDPVLYETENTRPIGALVFLSDSSLIFTEGDGLRRVDTATGQVTPLAHCPIELVRQIIPSPDRRTLVALTSSTIEVLRLAADHSSHLDCKQRSPLAPKFAPIAAQAADGETILIAFFDGQPELWQPTFRLWEWDVHLPVVLRHNPPLLSQGNRRMPARIQTARSTNASYCKNQ